VAPIDDGRIVDDGSRCKAIGPFGSDAEIRLDSAARAA
jgi:hypothetical protein